jgi:hypothetical protein
MHGFFMHMSLYLKMKILLQPETEQDKEKKLVEEAIESTTASRVFEQKRRKEVIENIEVNQRTAKHFVRSNREVLLEDPRFAQMWSNPEFSVDETSTVFKMHQNLSNNPLPPPSRHNDDEDEEDEVSVFFIYIGFEIFLIDANSDGIRFN